MTWSIASLFAKPLTIAKRPAPYRRRLGVEALEDRLTPAGFFLTGVGGVTQPSSPNARIFDASTSGAVSTVLSPPGDIGAFPGFTGSVRVASGDINGDGVDDIITSQGGGAGSGSQVRIFDGRSAVLLGQTVELASFFAYSDQAGASQTPGFGGGVYVAAADFNGDGFAELVTSTGAGGRGHVKVFNFHSADPKVPFLGSTPELRSSFYAYTDFAGEIRVTTLTFGGSAFLITGSGAGAAGVGQSDVRAYGNAYNIGQVADLSFVPTIQGGQLFPFAGFNGGVSVAAGDIDADGNDELFVSQNAGGNGLVRVYRATDLTAPIAEFQAFAGFVGEVRLGAADVDGDGRVEVLTSTGESPNPNGAHVKAFSITGGTATELRSFFAYAGYIHGVFLSTNDFKTTQTFTSTDTPVDIPDNGALLIRSAITVDPKTTTDTALKPKSISVDLKFDLRLGSGFNGDLQVVLQAPNGTQLTLIASSNKLGSGYNIRLSDTAVQNIENATGTTGVVTTGTFKPQGGGSLINTFGGVPFAGDWKLLVRDTRNADAYKLTSWSLNFKY